MPPVQLKPKPLTPYWTTTDGTTVRLYHGDVTDVLARLPEKSVHMCVTSPPYWGLRDYGTGTWIGGNPGCQHKINTTSDPSRLGESKYNHVAGCPTRDQTVRLNQGHKGTVAFDPAKYKSPFRGTATGGSSYLNQGAMTSGKIADRICPLGCGAVCSDNQLGSEPSPDCKTYGQAQCGRCHVCNIVAVFRGVYRVLRDDGTIWVNYGDSYNANTGAGFNGNAKRPTETKETVVANGLRNAGLKSGNLVGIPWRVALALQADGWVLRQDIIWHKPSPMPESVRNRCTKAHEYVFLLAKSNKYFYDAEAVKEPAGFYERTRNNGERWDETKESSGALCAGSDGNRNKRSVWTVASQGYEGAHFATFPPKLIEPMIKAGTSERGCCAKCGAPWKRVVEEKVLTRDRPNDYVKRTSGEGTGNSCANSVVGVETKTVGWEPTCECGAEVVPCTVLDPFIGSGTTCAVSIELGRRSVGIDLSEKYLKENAVPRIKGALLRRRNTAGLAEVREVKPVGGGREI